MNLNDPSTFNKMINNGNDIKRYLNQKEQELEEKAKSHSLIQQQISDRLSKKFVMPGRKQKKPKGLSMQFNMVQPEVEKILTKKPLQIKGFGISDEFRELFGDKAT